MERGYLTSSSLFAQGEDFSDYKVPFLPCNIRGERKENVKEALNRPLEMGAFLLVSFT